jgi:hypothetical protein
MTLRLASTGEPSPVLSQEGDRNSRPQGPDMAEVEREIVGLVDRSTNELRLAWRKFHHAGPPPGLSRTVRPRYPLIQLKT